MANYIVLEMDLNDKWWDKWFVVGGLSIDRSIQLNHYNYFSMSSVYMLTRGEDMAKKEFFVRKPRRNLKAKSQSHPPDTHHTHPPCTFLNQ